MQETLELDPQLASPTEKTASTTEAVSTRKADSYIWAIYICLIAISVVELFSASSREVTATNVFGPVLRHGSTLLLGLGITWGVSRMRFKWLVPLTVVLIVASYLIAIYVFFNGDIINGARRSMRLAGINLQSAELLKLAVVLIIAFVMSICQERRGVTTRGVVISAGMVLFASLILFTQGLTNTLLLMGVSFVMMLIAGVQLKKFLAVLLVYGVMGGIGVAYKMLAEDDREAQQTEKVVEYNSDSTIDRFTHVWRGRIDRFLEDSVPKYEMPINALNRQEMYSYMAQANGGWHGVLPGNSRETARLPLAFSDYIFAIVVEDWGFVGAICLLFLYLCLLRRAGAIASRCSTVFPALLVMGMAVMVVLQALFHMAIVTGFFPVSGQPLPMISKGGSSILVTSFAFGVMLAVSRCAPKGSKKKGAAEIAELPVELTAKNPGQIK